MSDLNQTVQERMDTARADKSRRVDFKMVTFALAGKDYGIDIMSVAEIAKANRFTYVPNAATFVRGVYNLRGEIISVIDLRVMFHLPAEKKEEEVLENLLILKVKDHVFGVIVDSIDKVVGVASETIQPPHPIFGDINVKYIRGVVENQDRLYIILDIAKIFAPKEDRAAEERPLQVSRMGGVASAQGSQAASSSLAARGKGSDGASLVLDFIRETLYAFRKFTAGPINQAWLEKRFQEWRAGKPLDQLQLREASDADAFLEGFYSPHTGSFWSEDYCAALAAALPPPQSKSITVWNPGCGRGYETYSFAALLKKKYPEARIKIWASDSDLLNISMAPNIVFDRADLPPALAEFAVQGKNGDTFSPALKDLVSFEYHDVLNANPVPDLDFVLCRDLLSFLEKGAQSRLISDFEEKLKQGGLVIPGANEDLSAAGPWKRVGGGAVAAFSKVD